jgi:dihydroorotate dehydrogenase
MLQVVLALLGAIAMFMAKVEGKLRPILAAVLPPWAVVFIYSASRTLYLKALGCSAFAPASGNYKKTTVMGMTFRNDLGNAAGLDKDGSLLELNYRLGAGFALVGTVLNKPHTGNLEVMKTFNPWVPLPASGNALNSLGLPSKGVDAAISNIKKFKAKFNPTDFPIGVSVMGHPAQAGEEKLQGVLDCVRKVTRPPTRTTCSQHE